MRIYTVGLGTVARTTVRIRGQTLRETLHEGTLQQIPAHQGEYFTAGSAAEGALTGLVQPPALEPPAKSTPDCRSRTRAP